MELVVKKCLKCGSTIRVIKDCNCNDCGITCCNNKMITLKSNSSDGAVEKHKPEYEIINNELVVTVNHVMEVDHYIEWICLLSDKGEEYVYFNPGYKPTAKFKLIKNAKIYSYCNKHGLWETIVE